MFSPDIVDSDAFLDMPLSSQLLYFHLSMRADDDGFVNPKKVMRMINVSDDDLKVLLAKRFLLHFESGVVVIKHWLVHNMIRKDRYKETMYLEEKKLLKTKENGSYTELATNGQPNVNQMAPQVRLGKVRIGQVREGKERLDNTAETSSAEVVELIDSFKEVNPSYLKWFANKSQRASCERLLKVHGLEQIKKVIKLLPQSNTKDYFPVITTPVQLEDKYAQLATAFQKYKNKETVIL